MEVLHQYLVGLFSENRSLNPDDILVVTPNLDVYSPLISAIFGTVEEGTPSIPFHLSGSSSGKSVTSRAFLHLLQLPDSRFKKEDLFDFLQQTAITDKFLFSQSDISKLMVWFEENRVVWGLDGEHRHEFQQPAVNLQTWREAMRRGWLGQLITSEPGTFKDDTLLFTGVLSSDEKELWAKFQHLLLNLETMKQEVTKDRSTDEWKDLLNRWIELFLPDDSSYEKEIQSIRDSIKKTIRTIETGGYRNDISFSLVRNNLIDIIDKHSSSAAFFTRGVLFHSMVPVRSLPFKVIALLGLNDDYFPRKPVSPEFDLMANNVLPGERDRKKEDRNLFLESVMAAGEIHYTSFIGRNQKDNEKLPPSPILDEWIQIVAGAHNIEPSRVVFEHSLNGFSTSEFRTGFEKSFSGVYCNLVKKQSKNGKLHGIKIDGPVELPEETEEKVVSIGDLESFFRNPPGHFFQKRLGVFLRGPRTLTEEEFELDGLGHYALFQHIFHWVLSGAPAEKMKGYLTEAGQLPEGWPGEVKLNEHISMVQMAINQIYEHGYEPGSTLIDINNKLTYIRIEGNIKSFSKSGMLDIHLSKMSGRNLLTSWIRHLLLCLNMSHDSVKTDLFLELRKSGKWYQFTYEPDAGAILQNLLKYYHKGTVEPVNLYIDSAFEYQWNIEHGEDAAIKRALVKWGGDFNRYQERSNRYLELILGRNAEADTGAIRSIAGDIMEPLVSNLKSAQ